MYAKYISEKEINTNIPTKITIDGIIYGNIKNNKDILEKLGFCEVIEETSEIDETSIDLNKFHFENRYRLENNKIIQTKVLVETLVEEIIIDRKISKMRLFEALYKRNLWNATETLINSDPFMAKIWELAVTLQEQHPLVIQAKLALITQFGLSDEEVEQIIIESEAIA